METHFYLALFRPAVIRGRSQGGDRVDFSTEAPRKFRFPQFSNNNFFTVP